VPPAVIRVPVSNPTILLVGTEPTPPALPISGDPRGLSKTHHDAQWGTLVLNIEKSGDTLRYITGNGFSSR
jgi:hypothetical protein